MTDARLPAATRDAWIADGVLSPFAAVSVYAPPRAYARFFDSPERDGWPPQVTRLEHTAVSAPNFNHWWLLDVHRARRGDARAYLARRPDEYVVHVLASVREMFGPSTEWHPADGTPTSPHHQHRQVLGPYETWFNRLMHGFPLAPFGLYLLLPVAMAGVWIQARALVGIPDSAARARGAVLYFCLLQLVYVVAASTMLTALEEARYRFQIEPLIWVVVALRTAQSRPGGLQAPGDGRGGHTDFRSAALIGPAGSDSGLPPALGPMPRPGFEAACELRYGMTWSGLEWPSRRVPRRNRAGCSRPPRELDRSSSTTTR